VGQALAILPKMSIRPGLFRLWPVATVLYMAVVGIAGYRPPVE